MSKTYTIIRPATHDEWLKQRTLGIGSSEVGTILGVNPYETPYQLWRRKLGIDPPVPENPFMRWGHYMEEGVAKCFELETGHTVIKASAGDWLAVDKQRDYLRVSPDRTYWLGQSRANDAKGIVECKSTRMKVDKDNIPPHWFAQLMYQLGVMNYREGYLAWVNRETLNFGTMQVAFDKDLYSAMVDCLEKFWTENLVGGKEPDIVTIDDVMLKYPRSNAGKTVEITDEVMDAITEIKTTKPLIKELESKVKEAEDTVKTFMADAEVLCLPGTKESNPQIVATWKTGKDKEKFDTKSFKADHADLCSQYTSTVPGSRTFLVK